MHTFFDFIYYILCACLRVCVFVVSLICFLHFFYTSTYYVYKYTFVHNSVVYLFFLFLFILSLNQCTYIAAHCSRYFLIGGYYYILFYIDICYILTRQMMYLLHLFNLKMSLSWSLLQLRSFVFVFWHA